MKGEDRVKSQKKFMNILRSYCQMVPYKIDTIQNHFLGFYLEVFGRRNNIRSKWVTIGNEI